VRVVVGGKEQVVRGRKGRLDRMRRSLNQLFHDQGDPQFLQ